MALPDFHFMFLCMNLVHISQAGGEIPSFRSKNALLNAYANNHTVYHEMQV